ncbi:hypothetical protein [Bacillus cereus group sp. TH228LC]|uniref:hypothetical protein n=1 Tax=Bacillus cereus group sp. TH228LC TaxID=3018049 RepID=UPI0022E7C1EB|nr:hypothetical protein [Bacillus cereus group sp. TH228LC]MDA1581925.1 hypothetical protein [Bacillus cereus group sp. TH228LC]
MSKRHKWPHRHHHCCNHPCRCNDNVVINDGEGFPIPSEAIPTDTNGGLFSIVIVIGFYLPGAETTKKDGRDRLDADLAIAREIWPFPIAQISPGIHLTNEDLGPNFNFPPQLGSVTANSPEMIKLQRIRRDFKMYNQLLSTKIVTVWYAPFPETTTGTIGLSWFNLKDPDDPDINHAKRYQHIIVCNAANDGLNESTIAHELGHIFWGTAVEKINGNLVQINPNGCDPTASQCRKDTPEDRHSPTIVTLNNIPTPNQNNVMNPLAKNKKGLWSSQIELATKTFLFL